MSPIWRRRLAALTGLLCLLQACPTRARPYTVEDLLQTESLGRIDFDPAGRWMVLEQRRPYATASRFDFNQQTHMLLTQLLKVDLHRPGGVAVPLFPQTSDGGVLAGPISPDGRRMLVYRLRDRSFELGVAVLESAAVRWFELTPELANHGAVAAWRSPEEVVAIVREPGDLPRQMALGWEAQGRLKDLWARTAAGRSPAATAVGSGRFLAARPKARPARLVRLDLRRGAVTVLARGEFQDLELSDEGRWATVIANGVDVQPRAEDAIYTAFPARRRHLYLVDLAGGGVSEPCPACDVSLGLLSWAPSKPHLVVSTRDPRSAEDAETLAVIDAVTGAVRRPLPPSLRLDLALSRNEQARRPQAAWMGEDLLAFARDRSGRADWYRLSDAAPVALTRAFRAPPRQLAGLTPRTLTVVADGGLWRVDRRGRATRLRDVGDAALLQEPPPPGARFAANPRLPAEPLALGNGSDIRWLGPSRASLALGAKCEPAAVGRSSAVAVCHGQGGRRDVRLGHAGGGWRTILVLNAGMADVRPADLQAVRPKGASAPSWLYLPTTPAPPAGHPLVVIPYRGAVHPRPDPRFEVGAFVTYLNPQLLAAQGYAVLVPSLPYDERRGEPAAGLAAELSPIIDAALADHRLDPARIGLWGHSFGGMNVIAAAAQSPRFKSVIAVSGQHDLISRWGAFPIHRWIVPEDNASVGPPGTVEGAQSRTGAPPWADPARYLRNSSIFAADKITAPVLLVHGETDELRIEQSQEMFTALYRQGKDAQMVTYWGEGHALASPANIRDYFARVLAWLEATLPARGAASGAPPPPPP